MHKIQFEVIYFKVGRTILLHKFLANSHQRLQQAKYIFGQNHFFLNFILFLNLKHCISFAKHQNESASGETEQISHRTFLEMGRGRGWEDLGEWH